MKIKINREIEIPDSLFCKRCHALEQYEAGNEKYLAAYCLNFNDRVFASKSSGWEFTKCRTCVEAALYHLHGVTK